ncbi:MAG TPA: glycosyltransferase [Pirellulaceae bacterium]|nr:glycosyltransferase [Pirellulaceae bacterium]HMO90635.1 glycosyltransferase [Pirellulaceae bacterium]HMP67786.1 glycosyltransferase [Pirellulaceae bacterium]
MTREIQDRPPLRCMFVITSMPVGGAETLLVNLVRRLDRDRIEPMICCLKEPGELGERIKHDVPLFSHMISHRYDVHVIRRLQRLFKDHRIDCVITVGAGDKMFWGRLAAKYAKVPVILSALHSTGWPDGVGRLNRCLTSITDGFIAVADDHQRFLIDHERFPSDKVFLIPNGIDNDVFMFNTTARQEWRTRLGIDSADPVVGIVAALRPEKNHELFMRLAASTSAHFPQAHFLIIGDGPRRADLQHLASATNCANNIHFLGSCSDIPGILSALDLFALTSHNEASPVSILEAMSCARPVVAPNVGSIRQAVLHEKTGYLYDPRDENAALQGWLTCLANQGLREQLGAAGREHVSAYGSLHSMTEGYMRLIERLHSKKTERKSNQRYQANSGATFAKHAMNSAENLNDYR